MRRLLKRFLEFLRKPAPAIEVCSLDGHIWRSLGSTVFGRQCSSCGALEFERNAPDGVEAYIRLFVEEGSISRPPDNPDTIYCAKCGRKIVEFSPGMMQYEGCFYCGNPFGECPCQFQCADPEPWRDMVKDPHAVCPCGPRCRCMRVKKGCQLKHREILKRGDN